MRRTLRFFSEPTLQMCGVYLAATVVLSAACRVSGRMDSLFGVYARVFPIMALMFAGVDAGVMDQHLNTALMLGARRRDCFAAIQLCGLVSSAVLVLLTKGIELATIGVPVEDWDRWRSLSVLDLAALLVLRVVLYQLMLLTCRISSNGWRNGITIAVMLVGAIGGSATTMIIVRQSEFYVIVAQAERVGVPVAAVLSAVLMIPLYKLQQKAVVRA